MVVRTPGDKQTGCLDPAWNGIGFDDMFRIDSSLRALTALMALSGGSLWAQVSPGTLSRAHSELDGAAHCVSCHDLGAQPPGDKCLDCHKEIGRRLETGRGLHPRLPDAAGKSCNRCHPEHNGRDFPLIRFETKDFDHSRTGYPLAGRHASLVCAQCHQASHISETDAAAIKIKDLSRTLLGLRQDCRSCHQDQHRGQFSAPCESCHDTSRWQNAQANSHLKARFPLTGPHEKVQCRKCHPDAPPDGGKPYVQFRNLSFADCAPCHRDPHGGAFPSACRSCHELPGWKPAAVSASFDHARARFPLEGKHAAVACRSCHTTAAFKQPVAHALCLDCHRRSPHGAQFAARADGGDCASCHTVQGFKPSTFNLARHGAAGFPLESKHAAVRCDQCHKPWGADVVYKIPDTRCARCHEDKHAGKFRPQLDAGQCGICHSVRGFRPSTFTPARHQSTRFPLTGAHGAVACVACHAARGGRADTATYRFESLACSSCHRDIHQGQFSARMSEDGAAGSPKDCTACHDNISWNDLPGFDHGGTSFPLSGAHRKAPCDRCHRRGEPKPELSQVVFRSAPGKCDACHEDEHGGQFAVGERTDCTRCHVDRQWKPSVFTHEKGAGYVPTGVHAKTPCAACHVAKPFGDRTMTAYKGTPRECSGCHKNPTPGGLTQDLSFFEDAGR